MITDTYCTSAAPARLRKMVAVVTVALTAALVAALPARASASTPVASNSPQVHRLLLPRHPATMADFLTQVLQDVHGYWTRKLVASGARRPSVRYRWVNTGHAVRTGCGRAVVDAFYCPYDDTIYVSQRFAYRIMTGRANGLPGQSAGFGRASGDFGVAYLIAHEYAHNIQQELGVYRAHRKARQSKPFELEADCMAGLWANHSDYAQILEPGDIEEALATAAAVGDFYIKDPDHHGTPAERRDALLRGYNTGDLDQCGAYVAGA